MLSKKSLAPGSIARNGEFQNPKGRILEAKFPIGRISTWSYFDEKSSSRQVSKSFFDCIGQKRTFDQSAKQINAFRLRAMLADDERIAPFGRAIDLHGVGWHAP